MIKYIINKKKANMDDNDLAAFSFEKKIKQIFDTKKNLFENFK